MGLLRQTDTIGALGDAAGAIETRCGTCRTIIPVGDSCPTHPDADADIALILAAWLTADQRACAESLMLTAVWDRSAA